MQTYKNFNFRMEYNENNEIYMFAKTNLEDIGHLAEDVYNKYKKDFFYHTRLSSEYILSCCSRNGQISLGLVNTTENKIYSTVSQDLISLFVSPMCKKLYIRLENQLYNNSLTLMNVKNIENLWDNYFISLDNRKEIER